MEREVDDDDGDGGDGGDGDDNMRRGVAVNAVVFDARRRTPLAAAAGEKFFIVVWLLVLCRLLISNSRVC
jgi:hypothetical protein